MTLRDTLHTPITPVSWHLGKAPSIARSSTAIEVQSASIGEEELQYVRLVLSETLFGRFSLKDWQNAVQIIPAALIMDCRGVFDALSKSESSCLGMKEKRTGIEAMAIKRSLSATRTSLRWCHSDAQLADCLTKGSEQAQKSMDLLKKRNCTWKIVYDPDFIAAKKRKDQPVLGEDRDPDDFMNYVPESIDDYEEVFVAAPQNLDMLNAMRKIPS